MTTDQTPAQPGMRLIEVSEDNYLGLEDHLDPDIKTHNDVISGMFGTIDALIAKQAELKAEIESLRGEVSRLRRAINEHECN